MGICGQAIKEDTQEKKDLTKRKNRLKLNIDALAKQLNFMNDISVEINTNKQEENNNNISNNNINNKNFINLENNNIENTFKFQVTGGNLLNVPVNDKTTIGDVLTNLYNQLNISPNKQIYLLYNGQSFNKTLSPTLFKKYSFNPNNPIVVVLQ